MGLDAIVYIIVFLAGIAGLIARVAVSRRAGVAEEERGERAAPPPPGRIPEDFTEDDALYGIRKAVSAPRVATPELSASRGAVSPEPASALPAFAGAFAEGQGRDSAGGAPMSAAGAPESAAVEGAGAVHLPGGWARIMGLPPLKRAVVLSELIGNPKALEERRLQ